MPRKKQELPVEDAPSTSKEAGSLEGQPELETKSFRIPYSDKIIQCLRYNLSADSLGMIFTHGAGGTLDAPAMINFAAGFAASKALLYFQGSMNLKSRTEMFRAVIENQSWGEALGGRSMGARAAVMAAHGDYNVKALVLVSYPLKNNKGALRDQILLDLEEGVDVLFISGDRDEMCSLHELERVRQKMKAKSWLLVARGADHGMNMKPKKATDEIGRLSGELAAKWLDERNMTWTDSTIGWDDENGTTFRPSWSLRQEVVSDIAKIGDPQSKTNAAMKIVSPKDTAKKSESKYTKPTRKEEGEKARPQKRGLKTEPAIDAPATGQTRPKRRKRV
jgi:predicted alpha/beta-hydrolase family hydrolase